MPNSPRLQISNAAVSQLEKILSQSPDKFLRITVMPGGCNGFEYSLKLDSLSQPDDVVFSPAPNIKVIIDPLSLDLIQGSELNYESGLIGSSFKLNNPNATTSCGCGNSFSV